MTALRALEIALEVDPSIKTDKGYIIDGVTYKSPEDAGVALLMADGEDPTDSEPRKLTEEQERAIEVQRGRWTRVGDPMWMIGGNGAGMWLAIEPDGYTHS